MPQKRSQKVKCNIKITEIGYPSETRYREEMEGKKAQHSQLGQIFLKKRGRPHSYFSPIILSKLSSLYNCSSKALYSLQVHTQSEETLYRKL